MLPATFFNNTLFNTPRSRHPFSQLSRLHREFDQLFAGLNGSARSDDYPKLELWSNEDEAVVRVELPGFSPEDVEVSVEKDYLVLKGERKAEEADDNHTYYRQERWSGAFERRIRLPYAVDADGVKATFENGVLNIELPRTAQDKPKKITVEAA